MSLLVGGLEPTCVFRSYLDPSDGVFGRSDGPAVPLRMLHSQCLPTFTLVGEDFIMVLFMAEKPKAEQKSWFVV